MTTPDQNSLPTDLTTDRSLLPAPDTRRSRAETRRRMAEQQIVELNAQLAHAPNDTSLLSRLRKEEGALHSANQILAELGAADTTESHLHAATELPDLDLAAANLGDRERAVQSRETRTAEDLTRIHYSRLWEEVLQIPRDMDDLQDSEIYWQSLVGRGREFEIAVGKLFANLGFDVVVTKPSGDEGVDVRVEKDGEIMVVQCKAQQNRVSTGILRELARVRTTKRAHRAACATTSDFAVKARQYAERADIYLFSPRELAELGTSAKQDMDILRGNLVIETDDAPSCPDCGKFMVQHLPHHSLQPFWGCSDYPRCEGTRPV